TLAIVVTPVNDTPVVSASRTVSLAEDGQLLINLLEGASDVDGDALTASITSGPQHGSFTLQADGTYLYQPQANWHGRDAVTYTISDGVVQQQITLAIVVTPVNDAPFVPSQNVELSEDGDLIINPLLNAVDVDGDSMQIQWLDYPKHGQVSVGSDQMIRYMPQSNWSGTDSFAYRLFDGSAHSQPVIVSLRVNAVADAPVVFALQEPAEGRVLFDTSWESVVNKNQNSTLLQVSELEGWRLLRRPASSSGGSNGFEIWSNGDRMKDASNRNRTVYANKGAGQNWFEMNNSGGSFNNTLGIEREIPTVLGAKYTFGLDVAGRLGFDPAYTKFGIYLDGIRIGGGAPTSGTSLAWQSMRVEFIGKGKLQSLSIVAEAEAVHANGRGVMLDRLTLTEELPANVQRQGEVLELGQLGARLQDTDGSEQLGLFITALPVGSLLFDGVNRVEVRNLTQRVDITQWNLQTIKLKLPSTFVGQLGIQLIAVATESANNARLETRLDLKFYIQASKSNAPTKPVDNEERSCGKTKHVSIHSKYVAYGKVDTPRAPEEDRLEILWNRKPADCYLSDRFEWLDGKSGIHSGAGHLAKITGLKFSRDCQ
ncbi:MAG TPA: cadherin-like domain-containing protein, partial [Limnobacter sp.]|nr:cadherin-like domain-containing protein [Limnobacter sp.]